MYVERLFEIKHVEHEMPFFQLGKQYFYQLTAEIYEQGADKFDTGIDEIDDVERQFSNITTLNLSLTTRQTATGTLQVDSSGAISQATVTLAGTGYNTPPNVTIGNVGNGSGGIITTSILDGGVVTLTIVNGGSGYDSTNVDPPTITIDAPPEAVQFLNDEHVVIGGFTAQGSGRSWTSSNKVITVTGSGGFDPVFATTTQK